MAPKAKLVWEHNTHVGDARASDMADQVHELLEQAAADNVSDRRPLGRVDKEKQP